MGVEQEIKVDWKKEIVKFSEGERSKTYKARAVGVDEEEGRVLKIRLKSNEPFEFEDEEKIKIKILREQQTLE